MRMETSQSQIGSNEAGNNHMITDDLALSAYLRMKGYHLIRSERRRSKSTFVFDIGGQDSDSLKVQFVNSQFLSFYNELRNMKKLIRD
jgi:hypothetical protein